jgi:hypothetical protein
VGNTAAQDIASPLEAQIWSGELTSGREGAEDDEDGPAASVTPQKIIVAAKIQAWAANDRNENRRWSMRVMALDEPRSWLRRKNIPHVS